MKLAVVKNMTREEKKESVRGNRSDTVAEFVWERSASFRKREGIANWRSILKREVCHVLRIVLLDLKMIHLQPSSHWQVIRLGITSPLIVFDLPRSGIEDPYAISAMW